MQRWDATHFGTLYSAMQSQGGTTGAQTNYAYMRHNLAAALMTDTYFGHGCGAPCNYNTNWWYDEYSVSTATGAPTRDASRKGYLGQANGAGGEVEQRAVAPRLRERDRAGEQHERFDDVLAGRHVPQDRGHAGPDREQRPVGV